MYNQYFKCDRDMWSNIQAVSDVKYLLVQRLVKEMNSDLTAIQLQIIFAVYQNKAVNHNQLAKLLQMNYGNLSTQCKTLQELKLIERRRDEADERMVQIKLTEEGAEVGNTIHNVMDGIFMKVLNQYDEEKLKEIMDAFQLIERLMLDTKTYLQQEEH